MSEHIQAAHHHLMEYRFKKLDLFRLQEKISTLRAKSFYQGSGLVQFSGGTPNQTLDPLGSKWNLIMDLEKEYSEMYLEAEQVCLEIDKQVNGIPNHLERIILNMYYCQMKSIKEISKLLNYQYMYISQVKQQGLVSFFTKYLEERKGMNDLCEKVRAVN